MTQQVFQFGERREGFAVPVLDERAVRAGADILFVLAMVSFMNAWLVGNFQPTRVFVVAFLIGFALAMAMFLLIVVHQVVGPANVLVCAACLVLMFFEAAFGICTGCKVYNLFHRGQPARADVEASQQLPALNS